MNILKLCFFSQGWDNCQEAIFISVLVGGWDHTCAQCQMISRLPAPRLSQLGLSPGVHFPLSPCVTWPNLASQSPSTHLVSSSLSRSANPPQDPTSNCTCACTHWVEPLHLVHNPLSCWRLLICSMSVKPNFLWGLTLAYFRRKCRLISGESFIKWTYLTL